MCYLSAEASAAGGGSLLWPRGRPAPAAPAGQSEALWVCRSENKTNISPLCNFDINSIISAALCCFKSAISMKIVPTTHLHCASLDSGSYQIITCVLSYIFYEQTCSRWLKMARHWESFSLSLFIRTWIRGGSRFQPIHLTISCREGDKRRLNAVCNTHVNKSKCWNRAQPQYLVLLIQDNAEDLGAVSLLDAGPSRDGEYVMVLWGVAVIREGLLY